MNELSEENKTTNIADLASMLSEAKKAIPVTQGKLKDKPKSPESYLILGDGTIAETDHSGQENGRVIISETVK